MIVFRSPPPAVQCALFGALAPVAHWRGYRATYPQFSRTVRAAKVQAQTRTREGEAADAYVGDWLADGT